MRYRIRFITPLLDPPRPWAHRHPASRRLHSRESSILNTETSELGNLLKSRTKGRLDLCCNGGFLRTAARAL